VASGLETLDSRLPTPHLYVLVLVFISPCIGGQTLSFGGQPRIFSGARLSSGAAPANGRRVCCKCRALFMWKLLRLRQARSGGFRRPAHFAFCTPHSAFRTPHHAWRRLVGEAAARSRG
jgi:hypothetical protein